MKPANLQRAVLQLLRDCGAAGLTHLPRPVLMDAADDSATSQAGEQVVSPASHAKLTPLVKPSPPVQPQLVTAETTVAAAVDLPGGAAASIPPAEQLAQLSTRVAACTRCQELASTRTQTVFGVGNPQAEVMFIGEAPGADEDRLGEPFVGKAGQLLTKIIEACGWQRSELYICNILRCRPPGNRNPTAEEAQNCREYLDRQIAIVSPSYIVCWGSVAAQNLLNVDTSIGRLRGKFFEYNTAKVLCTYHPSYLLRNPSAKKPVWEDMKKLLGEMGLTPPSG